MTARHVLNPYARRVLRGMIEVLVPDDPATGVSAAEMTDEVEEGFERMVGHMPPLLRKLFPLGLFAVEWGTLLFARTLRPFSRLARPDQERYLDGWMRSRFALRREMFKGVKAVCLMTYYSDRRVWAHIGYDPDPYVAEVIERRNRTYGDPRTRSPEVADVG